MRTTHSACAALAAVALAALASGCIQESPTSLKLNPGDGNGNGGSGAGSGTGNSGTGNSGNGSSSGGAYDYFVSNVYPLLTGSANAADDCAVCHVGGELGAGVWMGANADATYNAMDSRGYITLPQNSLLVLQGPHTGPALSVEQEEATIEWLLMEAEERGLIDGGGNPDDPPAPVGKSLMQALEEWGNCMQLEDWLANDLDDLHNAQANQGGTNYQCESCHTVGDGGCWLGLNDEQTFEMNRMAPYIFRLVTGTVDENGAFLDLIPANRFIAKGQTECPENFSCHPEYTLPQNLQEGVVNFVNTTMARWKAGECDLPEEPPPPAP